MSDTLLSPWTRSQRRHWRRAQKRQHKRQQQQVHKDEEWKAMGAYLVGFSGFDFDLVACAREVHAIADAHGLGEPMFARLQRLAQTDIAFLAPEAGHVALNKMEAIVLYNYAHKPSACDEMVRCIERHRQYRHVRLQSG